MMMKNLP